MWCWARARFRLSAGGRRDLRLFVGRLVVCVWLGCGLGWGLGWAGLGLCLCCCELFFGDASLSESSGDDGERDEADGHGDEEFCCAVDEVCGERDAAADGVGVRGECCCGLWVYACCDGCEQVDGAFSEAEPVADDGDEQDDLACCRNGDGGDESDGFADEGEEGGVSGDPDDAVEVSGGCGDDEEREFFGVGESGAGSGEEEGCGGEREEGPPCGGGGLGEGPGEECEDDEQGDECDACECDGFEEDACRGFDGYAVDEFVVGDSAEHAWSHWEEVKEPGAADECCHLAGRDLSEASCEEVEGEADDEPVGKGEEECCCDEPAWCFCCV